MKLGHDVGVNPGFFLSHRWLDEVIVIPTRRAVPQDLHIAHAVDPVALDHLYGRLFNRCRKLHFKYSVLCRRLHCHFLKRLSVFLHQAIFILDRLS